MQQFQLRYCPILSRKPTGQQAGIEQQDGGKGLQKCRKPDPFENPSAELLVAEISGGRSTHNLILNKYPVIPQHFILATKEYKEQTDLLEEDDLNVTYECLKEWEKGGPDKQLFAFFNSGDHSGASQGHRHLQFLPVEQMQGDDDDRIWRPLIDVADDYGVKG